MGIANKLAAGAIAVSAVFASTAAYAQIVDAPACPVEAERSAMLPYDMSSLSAKIATKMPIKFLTIGSSSTEGYGASHTDNTYPAQLEKHLRRLFPDNEIIVINKGKGNEDVTEMYARFGPDVYAERPDVVIFQAGVNWILRDRDLPLAERLIAQAIADLKTVGSDWGMEVMLMNSQYARKVLEKMDSAKMLKIHGKLSALFRVNVFDRHGKMERWGTRDKMEPIQYLHPDGLHLNDWGYMCTGELLANEIFRRVKPATVSHLQ